MKVHNLFVIVCFEPFWREYFPLSVRYNKRKPFFRSWYRKFFSFNPFVFLICMGITCKSISHNFDKVARLYQIKNWIFIDNIFFGSMKNLNRRRILIKSSIKNVLFHKKTTSFFSIVTEYILNLVCLLW
jgi:hypothetical protein